MCIYILIFYGRKQGKQDRFQRTSLRLCWLQNLLYTQSRKGNIWIDMEVVFRVGCRKVSNYELYNFCTSPNQMKEDAGRMTPAGDINISECHY
jgi:hypothetical protein